MKFKMKVSKKQIGLFIASLFAMNALQAQESDTTVSGQLEKLKSEVAALNNLTITGYVQAQAEFTQKLGNQSYTVPNSMVGGGAFPAYFNDRFNIRRGRLKFAYSASPLSQAVFEIDATESGVAVKNAYVKFTEPFARFASVTAGIFDRPYGYEIEYSASLRESPEESRMTQLLFPQDKDLGAKLTLQAPSSSYWNFIKLDVAAIAGNGVNADFDRFKDEIAHLSFTKSFLDEKLKISGGISDYWGGYANQTKYVYNVNDVAGVKKFTVDSASTNKNARAIKDLKGVDLQVSAQMPWGLMTVRGEYNTGKQPSTATSNSYPTTAPAGDTYIRKVQGYYVYFVQNILQSRHQIVLKYDSYDPNTGVKGSDIGVTGSKTSSADIKYSTFGLGYIFKIDAHTKIMFYGDFVKNEKTNIKETKDAKGNITDPGFLTDRKDNVFTVRLQYKF